MQIENNVDLKEYNTLQIPVTAKYFVKIEKELDIFELMRTDLWKNEKHLMENLLLFEHHDWVLNEISIQQMVKNYQSIIVYDMP